MTGRSALDFHRVVVKELMDNALDASETAGVPPVVKVDFVEGGALRGFMVADNGRGMPTSVIEKTLDFNTLTSDKALYRIPSRGQQGNALKTILGMPHALGMLNPKVHIWSGSTEHTVSVRVGDGDAVEVNHKMEAAEREGVGTAVTAWLPGSVFGMHSGNQDKDIRGLVRGYHLFNPHAHVSFRILAQGVDQ